VKQKEGERKMEKEQFERNDDRPHSESSYKIVAERKESKNSFLLQLAFAIKGSRRKRRK
jgi:hypothetical protein